MKKLLATILSLCLCVAFMVPMPVFAAGSPYEQGVRGGVSESPQAFDPYASYSFPDSYKAGSLAVPDNFSPALSRVGNGLLVTLPKNYVGDRIVLSDEFDFSNGSVGTFMFDGLAERNSEASISFFLDDAAAPFATFDLAWASGKTDWEATGDRQQVLENSIEGGPHTLSFTLDAGGKKTQLLLRSLLFMKKTGLPTIEFDIDESKGTISAMNSSEDHSRECYGNVNVHVPAGYENEYTGEVAASDTVASYKLDYVRGRGNSTWSGDKKPYKVKLNKKADLLGMGANKHWILLANRYDPSLMRNKITYWMGRELGMPFTPQCVFVDVVMNGTYYGSYYLCEQIRVGESRVEIDDLEDDAMKTATTEPEITGGYLLNMDYDFDSATIHTKHGYDFCIESPSFEDWENPAQVGYITGYLNKLEDALYGEGFKDANGKGYDEYLDVDAAIDYYWMQMLTKNGDAYGSGSTYLFKGREGTEHSRVTWGPLWDFDYVAWGDLEYDEYNVEGFDVNSAPWLSKLMLDDTFVDKMRNRWPAMKEKLVEITRPGGKLDEYAAQLAISQRYDEAKWGAFAEGYSHEYGSYDSEPEPLSYAEQVEQLRGWIEQRVQWIDENIDTLKSTMGTVKFVDRGKTVETRSVMVGEEIGTLPSPAPRTGYLFDGWWYVPDGDDEDEYDFQVFEESVLEKEYWTLEARWIHESEAVKVKKLSLLYDEAYVHADFGDYYGSSSTFEMPFDVYPYEAPLTSVKWTSSNTAIATVNSFGVVTPSGYGTVTITGSCPGGAKASYKLHIVSYDVDLAWPEYLELDPNEIVMNEGEVRKINVLLEPRASQFQYIDWASLNPSVADVGRSGLVSAESPGTTYICVSAEEMGFREYCKVTVLPCDLSAAQVKLKAKSATYNGKKKTPKVRYVKLNGKKLRAGKDYKVKLAKGRKKVGAYKVTIKGKGVYTGTKKVTFTILPPKAKLAKPKAKKNTIKVKVKKLSKKKLKQVSGYQVRWSTSKKFTSFKSVGLTIKKKKAKATLGKIKPGKRHYIQVRTYKTVKGKKYYSGWSKKVSIK